MGPCPWTWSMDKVHGGPWTPVHVLYTSVAVWLSVYSKIHESCKSEVKPQIKVVIVQQSATIRARFTIFTLRASQFRARPFLNRCGFAVYTTNETVSFWKRSTFESVFKTTQF